MVSFLFCFYKWLLVRRPPTCSQPSPEVVTVYLFARNIGPVSMGCYILTVLFMLDGKIGSVQLNIACNKYEIDVAAYH